AALGFVAALLTVALVQLRTGREPLGVGGPALVGVVAAAVFGGAVAGAVAATVVLRDAAAFDEGAVAGTVTALDPDGPRGGLCLRPDDPDAVGYRELCAALALVGPVDLEPGDRARGTWALLPPGDAPTNYVWFTLTADDR
ncbi:MAG TPA: hypothetical protein VK866_14400, partial [Acidimicrobiales bacterium]|nr:hypothetical protein [Acidimicrobiales bacterium]